MSDRNQRGSFEDAMARMEEIRASAEQTLTKYVEIHDELAGGAETEASSEDGKIKVKLNADGKLTKIEIADDLMRLKSNLGPKVIEVIEEAFATHALRQAEVAQRLLGSLDLGSLMAQHIPPDVMAKARDNLNG